MNGQQLKNSILQMAVQGKLVPQDPNDEPASVLIQRIREEKEKLIKEKKIKKEKNPSYIFRGSDNLHYEKIGDAEPVCIEEQLPFEIPDSWQWVRLNSIVSKEIKRGKSPKYADHGEHYVFAQKCNVKTGGINMSLAKYLSDDAFQKYPTDEYMLDSDIIVNSTGNGTLGRIGIFYDSDRISNGEIVPDSHVTIVRTVAEVNTSFVYYTLKYYQPFLEKQGDGSTNQTELKPVTIASLLIPLPPIEEQNRVVSKLGEAIPHIKSYDIKNDAITELNKMFPEQLKKSILQEAVQGKLVPQDPSDEPASVLLEHIREEKARLIKEGKIKKDKNESVIFRRDNSYYEKSNGVECCIDGEIPFEIPDSWEWRRLISVCTKLVDGDHNPPKGELEKTQFIMASSTNINNDTLVELEKVRYLSADVFYKENERTRATTGDILFTSVGSLGRSCIFDGSVNICFQRSVSVLTTLLFNQYLKYFFDSGYFQQKIVKEATGTAQKGFYLNQLAVSLIPVPPLAEQQRIVAKIEQFLAMIKGF